MKQVSWYVYSGKRLLTIVFYDIDCDRDYVYDGLVNHDGYPPNIRLVKGNNYDTQN